jgi:hypothetical protein
LFISCLAKKVSNLFSLAIKKDSILSTLTGSAFLTAGIEANNAWLTTVWFDHESTGIAAALSDTNKSDFIIFISGIVHQHI